MTDPHKMTITDLKAKYLHGQKITAITAYDYTLARIVDATGMDIILVGDSLGMVVQGEKTTLPVDIDDVIYHTRCVAKAVRHAHLMSDMPFLSYQSNHDEAVQNAGQLIKAGAESVKLEGGEEIADLVWYLQKIGIPVVGHVGLKPQSIHAMGGYKVQGKAKADADQIMEDAKVLAEAGACMLILEGIPLELAKDITGAVSIPTIGIGSGPHCSGQILVIYDALGADPQFKPRFVRSYMNLHEAVSAALAGYIRDVEKGDFPGESESCHRNLVEINSLKQNGK